MRVVMKGGEVDPLEVFWKFDTEVFDSFIQLSIITDIQFNVKGSKERFYVTFLNRSFIQDFSANTLISETIEVAALKTSYMSDREEAIVGIIGVGLQSTSLLTLMLAIGINMFQSFAMGSFWLFVDTVQILSYLPLIDCLIPTNLEMVLNDYLTIGDLTIPFDILPSWVPNPKDLLVLFETLPFNERFGLAGFDSLSFVYNFAEDLFTWIILIFFYLLLKATAKLFPSFK